MKVKISKPSDYLEDVELIEYMTQEEREKVFPGWKAITKEENLADDNGIIVSPSASKEETNDNVFTEQEEEQITLDRKTFDLLMKRVATEYEHHLQNELTIEEDTDPKKAKIIALCNRYGMKSFKNFLKIINAWELAQKGNLNKTK